MVDANGEPLVVYRGASFDPIAQNPGEGVIMEGAYFSPNPEYARRYGKVRAYYLNIRSPFDIRDRACLRDLKRIYPDHEFATGISGALDWGEATVVDQEFLEDNFGEKYDGLVYDEGGDVTDGESTAYGGMKHRGISYVPAKGGAQVKSATDNAGAFDAANPDIRFSVAQLPTGEKFVLLDRPNGIDWNDKNKVREYLATLVGTGAVSLVDGKRIEIGNELPDEYTRSKYAEKVFRNVRLRKVRAKAAQHFDELIAVSGERTAEPAKHKNREGGVYYRRNADFAVFGHEVKRGYSAELVTYEENGREYLYDLVGIKDKPSLVPDSATGGNGGFEILSTYNGEGDVPDGTPRIVPHPSPSAQGGGARFSIGESCTIK